MFKKTLIAAALATTASFGAAASTVAVTGATMGVEYAAGKQVVDSATVTITTGRDYAAGDIIDLTVSGASLVTTTGTPAVAVTPTITSTVGDLEFLQYSGNTVRLLVTTDTTGGTSTITVAGLKLNVAAAANEGTVKFSAKGRVSTVDGPIDVDSSTAVTALTFATELKTAASSKFDGVVDVNALRKEFVGGGTADTLTFTNTRAAVDTGVVTTAASYTIWGDFSFLDEDGNGELGDADDGTITSSDGTVTVAEDLMSAVLAAASGTFATGTVGITVTGPDDVVIPDQSFTASAVVAYNDPAGGATDKSITTLAQSAAGSWTLNGAKAHIPFLPFSSSYSQSVTISNTSSQSGGVDLVIYSGGDTIELEAIATAGPEGVTDISAAVRNAVANAGLSGNLSFDVIVNAPEASVTIEALYYAKADQDRLRTL